MSKTKDTDEKPKTDPAPKSDKNLRKVLSEVQSDLKEVKETLAKVAQHVGVSDHSSQVATDYFNKHSDIVEENVEPKEKKPAKKGKSTKVKVE